MLLFRKMVNKMLIIMRKGIKYYFIILENKGVFVFGILCVV